MQIVQNVQTYKHEKNRMKKFENINSIRAKY